MPGNQHAGAGRMLCLGDEVGGDVGGGRRVVCQDYNLGRAGQHVDGDLAVDLAFGQRHEQVAGADDHIDSLDAFDPISKRCHSLGTADAIHLGDAQLVTGGEHVPVVGAEGCRRHDDGQLLDAGCLGRTNGHEQRGWIRGRAAGNADAHAAQRPVAQP